MIALARKYRPRTFADLLVQDHVAAALRGAVARNRVGHGYLLTGPRGVGKTTAARILAMALNCERADPAQPAGEPCGECGSCTRIWSGSASLDVVEIDAASNRGVDDARELRERAMYAPSQAEHHKVYIVDEAHMLTREAWNALLKILEEPPPGVVFVFATTEPQKIAATAAPVLSRLQRFDFRRIGPGAIRDRLRQVLQAEGLSADEDALTLIARHADGGMRDALSVLDQCLSFGGDGVTAERVREVLGLVSDDLYADALTLVADRNPAAVFPLVDQLMDAGADLAEFIGGLGEVLRAMLMAQLGAESEDLTESLRQTVDQARQRLAPEDTVRMLRLLAETETAVRRSGNPRLTVETLLLRWAMMDRMVDLERVLTGGEPGAPASDPGARAAPRAPARAAVPSPAATRRGPAAAPKPESVPEPVPVAKAAPAGPVAFTLDGVRALWPELIEVGRQESMFLGQALASCEVASVEPPVIRVMFPPEHGILAGAVAKGRSPLEAWLQTRLGGPVSLHAEEGTPARGAERPKRLSQATLRAERLEGLRTADPALDAAVDELDLEILDESPGGGR
ncbi:MAG: DNA polymerase III subunit gamma/tau [Gemmatimonadota bacterium]|jgi:DNA polymerase-3 subunit gamma/tau|nr:DNA polymerase III subunit gamma/tau [Gemmatimonadota bacterium]